jgi:hypothetical protein
VEVGPLDPDDAALAAGAARDEDLAVVEEVEFAGGTWLSPWTVKTLG